MSKPAANASLWSAAALIFAASAVWAASAKSPGEQHQVSLRHRTVAIDRSKRAAGALQLLPTPLPPRTSGGPEASEPHKIGSPLTIGDVTVTPGGFLAIERR